MKFLAPRVGKYWPEAEELVSLKIDVIKIFLNYRLWSYFENKKTA